MIEHLHRRDWQLRTLGWPPTVGRVGCPGLPSQRSFHPFAVLRLFRCSPIHRRPLRQRPGRQKVGGRGGAGGSTHHGPRGPYLRSEHLPEIGN